MTFYHVPEAKEDLLNVINFSNWTYFNSEKISTKVYDVEIYASLYEQLLPSEYKERSIKEDEVVCIQYRKSVLSEEQDQFLIEKFNKNNFMLLQQKEIQIDVELKNKIKSICNSYIEPQSNNSYTDEILDKIRAAGIEVVTDKDEFDRILEQEERLQKMTQNLTEEEQKRYFSFNDEDTKHFIEQVKDWEKDNTNPGKLIIVGNIPPIMKVLGIADNLIEVEQSTLNKMIRDYPLYPTDEQGHEMTMESIYSIPSELANPVMVFKSKTRSDSYVFFTERKDNEDRTILIPMAVNKKMGRIVINEITSMYGRNNEIDFVYSNYDEDKLIYIDKKRSAEWSQNWLEKEKSSGGERYTKVQFLGQRFTDIETYNAIILTKEKLVNFISSDSRIISSDSRIMKSQKMSVGENIYGFVHNGKIYLNPEIMNSNAAVHEYTHLWDAYTQKTNPELWNKGLEIFKDSKYWNEVINDPNYQDIKNDENLVLSEIHSRICGNIAEKVLERIAELDGEQVKLDTIDWDEETWKYITEEMGFQQFNNVFHRYPYINPELEIRTSNLKDFLSTPMKDLMSEKKISVKIEETMEKQENIKNIIYEWLCDIQYNKDNYDFDIVPFKSDVATNASINFIYDLAKENLSQYDDASSLSQFIIEKMKKTDMLVLAEDTGEMEPISSFAKELFYNNALQEEVKKYAEELKNTYQKTFMNVHPLAYYDKKDVELFTEFLNKNFNHHNNTAFSFEDAEFILKYDANIDDKPDQLTIIDGKLYCHSFAGNMNNPQKETPDDWLYFGEGTAIVEEVIGRTIDLTESYRLSESETKILERLSDIFDDMKVSKKSLNESVIQVETPEGKQTVLFSENLTGVIFNGERYNTRAINYYGFEIPVASESLNKALTSVLENPELKNSDVYKKAYSLDEKYSAYIPEDVICNLTDEAIGDWCIKNDIEIVDSAELEAAKRKIKLEEMKKEIPPTKLSVLLQDLTADKIDYEIVNEKIHLIDRSEFASPDAWYENGLFMDFYNNVSEVIAALPDSYFESLYNDIDEQYRHLYPEQWADFEKTLNGGLFNCDDIYEFQKKTGDGHYGFVKYVVNPDLVELDEDKIENARNAEYLIYFEDSNGRMYLEDFDVHGDPLGFVSNKEKAYRFHSLGEALRTTEQLNAPAILADAYESDLLHVEENRLSAQSWENIKGLLMYEFSIEEDDIDTEIQRGINSSDSENKADIDVKINVVSELLIMCEGGNQDVFNGFNYSNKNIEPSEINETVSNSISKVAKELVTGNINNSYDAKELLKEVLWNDPNFQKAVVNGVCTFPEEHKLTDGKRELNAAGLKALFEKEFNVPLDSNIAKVITGTCRNPSIDDSELCTLKKNPDAKLELSYDNNSIYINDKQVTLQYLVNQTRNSLESFIEKTDHEESKKNLSYLDGLSRCFDVPSESQKQTLAEQFIQDVKKDLVNCNWNPIMAIKRQIKNYKNNPAMGSLNDFFKEIGFSAEYNNEEQLFKDVEKMTGVKMKRQSKMNENVIQKNKVTHERKIDKTPERGR